MSRLDDCWRRYKLHADADARQQIILTYSYLAKYVVDRMNLRPNSVISHDDLISHAIMGLIDAVEKFDLEKGVKFETYASLRMRGAVLDALKSIDWKPRSVRASEQDLRNAFAELEAELQRPATDEEVARSLGISVDALNNALADIGQSALSSLEEIMLYGEDGDSVTGLPGGDPSSDPAIAAFLCERTRLLAEAVDTLPDKEKLVVSLYYKDGLTLKEIAAVLGVSESRACQIHSKAMVRLHGKLARHRDILLAAA